MVDTLCTSGAVKHRVGAGAPTAVTTSGAWISELINQSEGEISALIPANVIGGFSGYASYTQKFLEWGCVVRTALKITSYDTKYYVNTPEGAYITNVLWAEWNDFVKIASDPVKIKALGITLLA